jgi:predicted amidohydrolase
VGRRCPLPLCFGSPAFGFCLLLPFKFSFALELVANRLNAVGLALDCVEGGLHPMLQRPAWSVAELKSDLASVGVKLEQVPGRPVATSSS